MKSVIQSKEFRLHCPAFKGMAVGASVANSPRNESLWQEIADAEHKIGTLYTIDSLKQHPAIEAMRRAYRACGKDPSRYRPSSEALIRRTLQGKPLYQINTIVDLGNLASLVSGYSIGVFDARKIAGDTLTLGIGRKDEPYEGIGRGTLNIEGLPVYRDLRGGIGTPTSDHERTKVELSTCEVLILINGYDGCVERLNETTENICRLLRDHAAGRQITTAPF